MFVDKLDDSVLATSQVRLSSYCFGHPEMAMSSLRRDEQMDIDVIEDDPFPSRLRQARELRKLGPGDLSERTGVPGSSISHFEAGRRKPSFDSLRKIAMALEVSTDYLLGLVDDPTPPVATDILFRKAQALSERDRALAGDFIEMLRKRSQAR